MCTLSHKGWMPDTSEICMGKVVLVACKSDPWHQLLEQLRVFSSFVPNWKTPKVVTYVANSGHKYHRLKPGQCLCQEAAVTGRKVCDFNSKAHFFPGSVQPVFAQASLSSAGPWRKSSSPKAAQISLHIPTEVLNALHFFLLLWTS